MMGQGLQRSGSSHQEEESSTNVRSFYTPITQVTRPSAMLLHKKHCIFSDNSIFDFAAVKDSLVGVAIVLIQKTRKSNQGGFAVPSGAVQLTPFLDAGLFFNSRLVTW